MCIELNDFYNSVSSIGLLIRFRRVFGRVRLMWWMEMGSTLFRWTRDSSCMHFDDILQAVLDQFMLTTFSIFSLKCCFSAIFSHSLKYRVL